MSSGVEQSVRMRRTRTAVAVAAGLVALVLAAPATAVAAPAESFVVAECATGAITRYAGTYHGRGQYRVTVAGWIQPCGEFSPDATFGIMHYFGTVATLVPNASSALRPYRSTTAPTTFRVDYRWGSRTPQYGPLRALCVVRSYHDAVACVGVDQPARGGRPRVFRIRTDDPRVTSVPVLSIPGDGKTGAPFCGTCV